MLNFRISRKQVYSADEISQCVDDIVKLQRIANEDIDFQNLDSAKRYLAFMYSKNERSMK